jgi:class 3 adenylate cyclase
MAAGSEPRITAWMGDGVLLYFGYPQAHEDDAERAVRHCRCTSQAQPNRML